jgi:hypothetical protein
MVFCAGLAKGLGKAAVTEEGKTLLYFVQEVNLKLN